MSRINEALERLGRAGAAPSPAPAAVFTPAWDVPAEAPNDPPDRLGGLAQPVSPGLVEFSSKWRDRLATSNSSHPALLEQFRRLAATLHQARRLNGLRTLIVTSATPGDGKTLTAVNLALVLAACTAPRCCSSTPTCAGRRSPGWPTSAKAAG